MNGAIATVASVRRRGLVWEAREVLTVLICEHGEMTPVAPIPGVVAHGLTEDSAGRKLKAIVHQAHLQHAKDAADRAASEALGG